MANTKKYDLVAKVGEYKDSSGETKARWMNCGAVFENERGLSLKLNCVPVGSEWNGWFNLSDSKGEGFGSGNGSGRNVATVRSSASASSGAAREIMAIAEVQEAQKKVETPVVSTPKPVKETPSRSAKDDEDDLPF